MESGMPQSQVDAVPIGEAFQRLVAATGMSADTLTAQLYATNNVGGAWYIMSTVGVVAAAGLYAYGCWTYKLKD